MKGHVFGAIATAMILLLTGCGSTLVLQSQRTQPAITVDRPAVFVRNPQLAREYAILRDSGIYQITQDKDCPARVTLHPIRCYGACGQPLLIGAMTLGIVPVPIPAGMEFLYELETPLGIERCGHRLALSRRFSIWEWLIPENEEQVIAEALAKSDRQSMP